MSLIYWALAVLVLRLNPYGPRFFRPTCRYMSFLLDLFNFGLKFYITQFGLSMMTSSDTMEFHHFSNLEDMSISNFVTNSNVSHSRVEFYVRIQKYKNQQLG